MEPNDHPSRHAAILRRILTLPLIVVFFLSATAQAQESDAQTDTMVEATIRAVVGLRSTVPETARTARTLGTERAGNGIVIDDEGLVLTIGYLVMEASDIEITNGRGEYVPADLVAYDYDTGFGLVRSVSPLGIDGIALGDSSRLGSGDAALVIAHMGPDHLQAAEIVDVREFPGYWEYLLEDAIFTTPPIRGFGGAALIDRDGSLVGVGSLIVSNAQESDRPVPGNMFVPINALKPILDDLVSKGRAGESRPWLGVYTEQERGHLFVQRVAEGGPAETAGLKGDDIIIAVNGNPVSDMASFLRQVWATGPAGSDVVITVLRGGETVEIIVASADRYRWLKLNPGSRNTAGRVLHYLAV